jgi:hypothetical protein
VDPEKKYVKKGDGVEEANTLSGYLTQASDPSLDSSILNL